MQNFYNLISVNNFVYLPLAMFYFTFRQRPLFVDASLFPWKLVRRYSTTCIALRELWLIFINC